MITNQVEVLSVPPHDIPETDPVDLPYDPHSDEGWQLTSEILQHRLGEYSIFDRSANYLRPASGVGPPGFQEEYPVEFMRTSNGDTRVLNLIAKGFIAQGPIPAWLYTRLGLCMRDAKNGSVIMTDPSLAIVRQPFNRYEREILTANGNLATPSHAERTVRYLRLAKKFLYFPEYAEYYQQS